MAYSKKNYTGDGVTKLFSVTFPYIEPSHISVTINGIPSAFTFQSKFVIEFATAPANGALIQIKRSSNPDGRLVDFQDDSMGTEAIFDLNSDQLLFLAQEALDNSLEGTVIEQVQDIADSALASALAAAQSAEDAEAAASAITLPIPLTAGGTGATTAGAARTALGLGTAATKNTGLAAGNVVEVATGGKLPVIDASPVTGLRRIVQEVLTPIGFLSTTALIPFDDTIPQSGEGFQAAASSITPLAIGNKLIVEVLISVSSSLATGYLTAALFRDSIPDAVAAEGAMVSTANGISQIVLRYETTAASLALTTFSLRVGGHAAGTTSINGRSGSRLYGGAYTSYMNIYEVKT